MARLYRRGQVWWTWGRWADGTRWQESTGCHDRRAAERVAIQLERERATLDRAEATPLGIERLMLDVTEARRREGRAESTIAVYRQHGGHLCRVLGHDTDAHRLTLADLERYIDVRALEGAMRSTISMELVRLRAGLLYAARHGRYRGSVAAIWPAEALRGAHKPRERYLTHAEYVALRDELERCAPGRGDWLAAYCYTGASRRELQRVIPRDVDASAWTMRIRGAKTRYRDRVVPIAEPLRPVVERRLALAGTGPLWPEWTSVATVLRRACSRLGIPSASPNDLRRTFCSWLAQAGVTELIAARMMGHGSSRMVRTVYARFAVADLAAAVARLPGADCSDSVATPTRERASRARESSGKPAKTRHLRRVK